MKSVETKAADTVTGMVGVSSMSPASTVSAADFSAEETGVTLGHWARAPNNLQERCSLSVNRVCSVP